MDDPFPECDLHPGLRGNPCPACQRTDSNILGLMRRTNDILKRLAEIESKLEQIAKEARDGA